MTAYTTISNALVAVGAKPFATTIQALRDNPIAIAEGAVGSPVNAAGWHPYDMVNVDDGNDGKFYDFATNGVVASIVTPDFVDGYEYRVRFEGLGHNDNAASVALTIELYRETDAAYGSTRAIAAAVVGTQTLAGQVELPFVRRSVRSQPIRHWAVNETSAGMDVADEGIAACVRTAQKRTRARFTFPSESFDAGRMYLDRRRAIY
jgi:hypothetical protein